MNVEQSPHHSLITIPAHPITCILFSVIGILLVNGASLLKYLCLKEMGTWSDWDEILGIENIYRFTKTSETYSFEFEEFDLDLELAQLLCFYFSRMRTYIWMHRIYIEKPAQQCMHVVSTLWVG